MVTITSIILTTLCYTLKKIVNLKFLILSFILDIWNIGVLLGGFAYGIMTSIIILELWIFQSTL